ncbi:calcium-binding protein [Microvirga sp. RSM25]|uniref:calcium-binding protein n=1 Tax=Microvirga sp. RSM25 TaxID=3273802 RepID=UPI00384AAC4C
MATHDPVTNTYTLVSTDVDFALLPQDGDANVIGNDQNNQITGNAGANSLDGGKGADTLRGGLGDDTYLVDEDGDRVFEDAVQGSGFDTTIATFSYKLEDNVEKLILVGGATNGWGNDLDNVLTGNQNDNFLDGGEGNDTLIGGGGADTFRGGRGDDVYHLAGGDDVIEDEDAVNGGGNDTIISSSTVDLEDFPNIENLTLEGAADIDGFGNALANTILGNDGDNTLDGRDGNDSLLGGLGDDHLIGGAGADTLVGGEGLDQLDGGTGDDTYIVDSELDIIHEQVNEGSDRIVSSISFNLSLRGANVENLELTGTANLTAVGNSLANTIIGNDGSNTLNGGAGTDDLWGGKGNDTYIIDASDTVHEEAGEGRDTVLVGFSLYTLASNVEDLTYTGAGNFSGTGNELNNFIRGNAGNDTLVGSTGDDSLHGGAGADRMDGGAGSDLYWVDNAGDVIVDSGAGFDRVLASASYTLGANLEYLAFEGSGNFSGTGNELDNTMYGNTGANTLDGGAGRDQLDGGEGADRLLGGAGDDTITDWRGDDVIDGGAGRDDLRGGVGNDSYVVDGLDMVTELAGQGVDTVTASESFTLGAASEVEILLAKAGTSAITLTGSATANAISGNDGANLLSGEGGNDVLAGLLGKDTLSGGLGDDRLTGGIGKDTLSGNAGYDTFVFDSRFSTANADKVTTYNAAEDRIFVENSLLKANKVLYKAIGKESEMKPAALASKFFTIGSKAKDKDDFFVLDKKKYTLSYDADGSGSNAAIKLATFDKNAMKKFTHKELFFI